MAQKVFILEKVFWTLSLTVASVESNENLLAAASSEKFPTVCLPSSFVQLCFLKEEA